MINQYKLILFTASAVAALLGVTGCGSSNGGSAETAQAPLTLAEFQEKADFICEGASNEQFEKAGEYSTKHPGAAEADWVEPAGIPPLEKELQELRELPPPSGLKPKIEAFLAEFEKALQQVKKEPVSMLQEKGNPFEKTDQIGEKYELGDCSLQP
ncbi:MAG: hypothetical protein ACTHKT_06390 [Solirubrobacterales bacterium]